MTPADTPKPSNPKKVRKFTAAAVVAAGLILSTGCGPIVSGVQIVNADVAVSAAETAGAKKHAVYEYTAAGEYLRKAREEYGYSDFSASREYADKALELAERAREKAEAVARAGQPVVTPPPPP